MFSLRSPASPLRLSLRTLGLVGLTTGMVGLMELQAALAAARARPELLRAWKQRYGRALLGVFGVDLHARGPHLNSSEGGLYPGRDTRGKGRLFLLNHRSGLDIALALAHLDATLLSRADLATWPVLGMAARRVGTVFVDRGRRSSGAAAIRAMAEAVEAGQAIALFPEGTTWGGDDVRPFHGGAFRVALRTGAELVPVGLAYEGEHADFRAEDTFLQHMRRVGGAKRTRVALVAGEPLTPADVLERVDGVEEVVALRERARAAVQVKVLEARRLLAGTGELGSAS